LPVQVMISRWFQRGHGLANSVAQSGSSLGQLVLIGLLATFLKDLGWRAAFSVLGVAFLFTVIPLVLTMVPAQRLPRPVRGAPAPAAASEAVEPAFDLRPRALLKNRGLWSLTVVYFICGFHDIFTSTHLVAFATDEGMSQSTAGQLLAAMGVMALLGVLAAGVMSDTIGASAATLVCFLLRIAIFGLVLLTQQDVAIFLFGLAYGFTFPITAPIVSVFARDLFGYRHLGLFSSLILMIHQIGGGVGALAGGVLFDASGNYERAFLLMILLAILASAATLVLMQDVARQKRKPALQAAGTGG
jgi:predicted MFS family arabinose efflux permease